MEPVISWTSGSTEFTQFPIPMYLDNTTNASKMEPFKNEFAETKFIVMLICMIHMRCAMCCFPKCSRLYISMSRRTQPIYPAQLLLRMIQICMYARVKGVYPLLQVKYIPLHYAIPGKSPSIICKMINWFHRTRWRHIPSCNMANIDSYNTLWLIHYQAITWGFASLLLIGTMGTIFRVIWMKIPKKMHLTCRL